MSRPPEAFRALTVRRASKETHRYLPPSCRFFFTLANAGVKLNTVGPLTLTIFFALVAGKIVGIMGLVLLASKLGIAPLTKGFSTGDLAMAASMASVGLTVALFIAGEAFQDEVLASEAKMGSLLSGLMVIVTIGISKTPLWRSGPSTIAGRAPMPPLQDEWGADEWDDDVEDDVSNIVTSALERALLSRSGALGPGRAKLLQQLAPKQQTPMLGAQAV